MKDTLLGALLLAMLAFFFWLGYAVCDRDHAKADLAATRTALTASRNDLTDYHAALQSASAQFERDANVLRGIAEDYTNGRIARDQFYIGLEPRLDSFLAARPDLAACDIGPVGLQLWNDANRGNAAQPGDGGDGTANAEDRSQPAGGVSAAAVGHRQPSAGVAAQPHGSGASVQRLPRRQARPDQGGENHRSAGSSAPAARADGRKESGKAAAGVALVETIVQARAQ